MNIRFADAGDIDALVTARSDYLQAEYDGVTQELRTSIAEPLRQYYERHLNTDFFAALALDDNGTIVSTAFMLVFEKPFNPHWPTGKTGTILNVRTLPAYRKQGIATKLLNLLIEKAKEQNLSYIDLAASEMGQPIYEKLGFHKPEPTRYTNMELPL